jgi:glycogen synthase
MIEMKLISVVIPCYNHGVYLEDAVESVLAQSFQNVEIIIVNDGSTDPYTNDLLRSFDRPRCRVIHTENKGLSAARNNGIKETSGEYLCCLDADDKYHPDYFSKAATVLDHDKKMQYGSVPAWVQLFGSNNHLWKTLGSNSTGFEPFLQGIRNNIHSSTMFRRICWEQIGGFDESMTLGYEDWDFWIKMLDLGYQWFCLEEPLIYYRQKEHSMVTRANEVRPRLLKALINNNNDFFVKYLVPILQTRDNEVLQLKKENKILADKLAVVKRNQQDGIYKSSLTTLCIKARKSLGRLFSSV